MNQEQIKEMLKPSIQGIDRCPVGQFIPSDWKEPEGYIYKKFEVEGIPVEHLMPKEKKTDKVVIQLHGGGYILALIDAYRDGAIGYSQIAGGAEVFTIDYRVAPTHLYPSALEDVVKVYKWIIDQGYDSDKIIIVGDSAGGNLALATTLYLKDQKIKLPKLVIAISPWADIEGGTPSREANKDKDLILGSQGFSMSSELIKPTYMAEANLKSPYVSPIHGDYSGFPNLLIQVGSYEVLLDDAVNVAKKAKEAGVTVRQSTYEGMSHVFQLLLPTLEKSQAAWGEIAEVIQETFA